MNPKIVHLMTLVRGCVRCPIAGRIKEHLTDGHFATAALLAAITAKNAVSLLPCAACSIIYDQIMQGAMDEVGAITAGKHCMAFK
jgi:hypothetical protein